MEFDLEVRTLEFGKRIIFMCQALPSNTVNWRLIDQIIRSGGSVGANYREANDSLGEKDKIMRMKIARKEAKETEFWLELIMAANPIISKRIESLYNEAVEIRKILSVIIYKLSKCNN